MTRLWNRVVRVKVSGKGGSATFDGRQIPEAGLKIGFDVTKTLGSSQNTGTVTVWNLSKSRRNMLGDEYDKLELYVGYNEDGEGSLLLTGAIRDVKHTKDAPDICSTIEVGDGDKGVNKGSASKTFKAGTKPKEVVDYLVKRMPDVEMGKTKGLDDLPAYKRPITVFGFAANALNALGRQHLFYWSIQNGKFEAMKNDQHLGDTVLVSKETGMIGIAEPTDKGVKFKSLINTRIIPGRQVQVKSDFLDETSGRDKRDSDAGGGLFRVSSAQFTGDSRDAPFYVEVEANRIQADKVVK